MRVLVACEFSGTDWKPTAFMQFPGTIIGMSKLDGRQLVFCQSGQVGFRLRSCQASEAAGKAVSV